MPSNQRWSGSPASVARCAIPGLLVLMGALASAPAAANCAERCQFLRQDCIKSAGAAQEECRVRCTAHGAQPESGGAEDAESSQIYRSPAECQLFCQEQRTTHRDHCDRERTACRERCQTTLSTCRETCKTERSICQQQLQACRSSCGPQGTNSCENLHRDRVAACGAGTPNPNACVQQCRLSHDCGTANKECAGRCRAAN